LFLLNSILPPTIKMLSSFQERAQLSIDGSQVTFHNLSDHLDMARPPHENPEYHLKAQTFR